MTPPSTTTVDLLVIGSGAAGLSAAVTAAHGGLDVLVVEKEHFIGGTTALSGGWAYIPNNPNGVAAVNDTYEEITTYLKELAGDRYDEAKVGAFLRTVPDMVQFFETETSVRFVYPELAPDYHMKAPGAKRAGRCVYAEPVDARVLGEDRMRVSPYKSEITVFGVMPQIGPDLQQFLNANRSVKSFAYVIRRVLRNWGERAIYRRGLDLSNGNALIARLVKSSADAGVRIDTDARVTKLIVEHGAVVGAEVAQGGATRIVRARHGVVLANGGFSQSEELREKFFPHGATHYSPTAAGSDGDNYRLGTGVGAAFDSDVRQPAAWAPVTIFQGTKGRTRVFPHLRGVGLPGVIAVDRHGRRFVNESNSYHQFCQAMLAANEGESDVHAFLLADAATMHKYGLGFAKPWPIPHLRYYRNGYLHSGKTLRALAENAGIDPDELERTVAEFNVGARSGVDPLLGRGEDEFNWFKGDMTHKPNPSLAPVEKGPYFAAKVRMGDLGTFAGLATDDHGRALDESGTPIPGLFAAGSAAVSVFGGAYPGHGANIGPAMTWGFAIGRHAAKEAKKAAEPQSGVTS